MPEPLVGVGDKAPHPMDEVLSGVRSTIAVKIFGPDLADAPPLPTQADLEQASGQVLRGCTRMLVASSGGTRRPRNRPILITRYKPTRNPEPVQAQEDRQDGKNLDG